MKNSNKIVVLIIISVIAISLAVTIHEVNDFANRLEIQKTQEVNAERILRQSAEANASSIQQSADEKIDSVITEANKFNYGA